MTNLYLRPNVQVEPLFDRWYAWSYLIPPATAARNITERHLRIMDSYILAPDTHAAAVKDRRLLGGPFVDYDGKRVDDITRLRDNSLERCKPLIELSAMIGETDALLRTEAKGYSLQPLYNRLPDGLRGYVELVYDLNSQPSFRLLEGLLYKSAYYNAGLQSFGISEIRGDDRPFALSTPRLERDDVLEWRVPFSAPAVDAFFRTKSQPRPREEIQELVGATTSREQALLDRFLSRTPARDYVRYAGHGARWRYFGHACVLVETPRRSILFDPVLSYTYEADVSRYTYLDLPDRIDYVIITHNHQDHILLETLLQIRHKVRHVVVPRGGGALQDPCLKLLLEQIGFANVLELGELESISDGELRITAIPFLGEHSDLDIKTKSAYVVGVGEHTLMFAADSCNIEPRLYELLHREIGDVDALFIGMECVGAPLSWLYGPLLTRRLDRSMDDSRRLAGSNYEQAIHIVDTFKCREVYVYAMGQEPWLNYVMSLKYTDKSRPIVESNRLLRACADRGIVAERLFGEREMFLT